MELSARYFFLCHVSPRLNMEKSSEGKHSMAETIQKLVDSFLGE